MYNKVNVSKMYNLMSLDIRTCPWKCHHNLDERIYHSPVFLCPYSSFPSASHPQETAELSAWLFSDQELSLGLGPAQLVTLLIPPASAPGLRPLQPSHELYERGPHVSILPVRGYHVWLSQMRCWNWALSVESSVTTIWNPSHNRFFFLLKCTNSLIRKFPGVSGLYPR